MRHIAEIIRQILNLKPQTKSYSYNPWSGLDADTLTDILNYKAERIFEQTGYPIEECYKMAQIELDADGIMAAWEVANNA